MGRPTQPRGRVHSYWSTGALSLVFAGLFSATAFAQASPVQWTNIVNATATGSALQKTAGCSGCSDAGATSVQTLSHDGFVEFVPVSGTRLYAGLGSNTTANVDPALIDFAFSLWQ